MLHPLVSRIKELADQLGRTPTKTELMASGVSDFEIRKQGGHNVLVKMAGLDIYNGFKVKEFEPYKPKILLFDIETSLMKVYTFGIRDQFIDANDIIDDWYVLSWAAKWLDDKKVIYADQRMARQKKNDKKLLKGIWDLLDQADIVIGHNSDRFDLPRLYARFSEHKMGLPSSFRSIDTYKMSKRLGYISRKLEYLVSKLTSEKKLSHSKFPGKKLWIECDRGNQESFKAMEEYNRQDVLALQALYEELRPYAKNINFNTFNEDSTSNVCSCGSTEFDLHETPKTTNTGRFNRYICKKCGAEQCEKQNLLSKEKRKSLRN